MSRMRMLLLRVALSAIVLIAASALTARVSLADSVTLNASADAYFIPGNATNFGALPTILVGSGASLGLVQFDLSSLSGVPAASVTSATFSLWVTTVNTAGTVNVDTVSEATPWTELTVNGLTGVSPQSPVATAVSVSTTGLYITVDATSAVQAWLTTPPSNDGFLVSANGSTNVAFASRQNTTVNEPPILTITSPDIVTTTPEPMSLLLMGSGLLGLAGYLRRK